MGTLIDDGYKYVDRATLPAGDHICVWQKASGELRLTMSLNGSAMMMFEIAKAHPIEKEFELTRSEQAQIDRFRDMAASSYTQSNYS
jgi:hypothetical protein